MKKIRNILRSVGVITIESEVASGVKIIEGFVSKISDVKKNLLTLIGVATTKKASDIDKKNKEIEFLQIELEGLYELIKEVKKIGK
jgi:hypothetical protein